MCFTIIPIYVHDLNYTGEVCSLSSSVQFEVSLLVYVAILWLWAKQSILVASCYVDTLSCISNMWASLASKASAQRCTFTKVTRCV